MTSSTGAPGADVHRGDDGRDRIIATIGLDDYTKAMTLSHS